MSTYKYRVGQLTRREWYVLWANARRIDKLEWGGDPHAAYWVYLSACSRSERVAPRVYTNAESGEVVCVWGIQEPDVFWLLGTEELNKHPKTLITAGKMVLRKFGKPHLKARLLKSNVTHGRWLNSLGFRLHEVETPGPYMTMIWEAR